MCIILPEQKHPTGKPYLTYFYRSISRQSYEVIKTNSLFNRYSLKRSVSVTEIKPMHVTQDILKAIVVEY